MPINCLNFKVEGFGAFDAFFANGLIILVYDIIIFVVKVHRWRSFGISLFISLILFVISVLMNDELDRIILLIKLS